MPVLWVHGVTVRRERFDNLLNQVRAGISCATKALAVEGHYWGDDGTSLRYGGASIPGFLEGVRAFLPPAEDLGTLVLDPDQLAALLVETPFLELAALRDAQEFDPDGAGFLPMPPEVGARNQALKSRESGVVGALQADGPLSHALGGRVGLERIEAAVADAINEAGRADRALTVAALIDPLTRCITARLYREAIGEAANLDGAVSWTLAHKRVGSLLEANLGGQRVLGSDFTKEKLREVGLALATGALRRNRKRIMEAMSVFMGDVLVYIANRDALLGALEAKVTEVAAQHPGPLWLVGHSLGGVMCMDYCAEATHEVARLVTVGSQVGLLGEIGVLRCPTPPAGGPLVTPAQIGAWLNIYDTDDLLSFRARGVFDRVVDIDVDTEAPFPASHSEYWVRPEVYDWLVGEIPVA